MVRTADSTTLQKVSSEQVSRGPHGAPPGAPLQPRQRTAQHTPVVLASMCAGRDESTRAFKVPIIVVLHNSLAASYAALGPRGPFWGPCACGVQGRRNAQGWRSPARARGRQHADGYAERDPGYRQMVAMLGQLQQLGLAPPARFCPSLAGAPRAVCPRDARHPQCSGRRSRAEYRRFGSNVAWDGEVDDDASLVALYRECAARGFITFTAPHEQ